MEIHEHLLHGPLHHTGPRRRDYLPYVVRDQSCLDCRQLEPGVDESTVPDSCLHAELLGQEPDHRSAGRGICSGTDLLLAAATAVPPRSRSHYPAHRAHGSEPESHLPQILNCLTIMIKTTYQRVAASYTF